MSPTSSFVLKPAPPFRLDLTVWALRRRPSNLIDRWEANTYRRALALNEAVAEVAVNQIAPAEAPLLKVAVSGIRDPAGARNEVVATLERLLGFRADLAPFYRLAAGDRALSGLVERFRGLKPPRLPTVFEALVNAIACQQMSLALGILLLSRLTARFGRPVEGMMGIVHAFPRPEELAKVEPGEFRQLGFSRQKARAITALAQACRTGQLDLESLGDLDDQTAVERLRMLHGVGRWSAEYALLRGLGRWHIYPGDDVGARNNLQRWLKLKKSLDYAGVRHIIGRWQPYSGLVYFHLLLDRLETAGHLGAGRLVSRQPATVSGAG